MTTRKVYATGLSDREWQIIEPLLPGPKRLGRKITYSRREILNALFYLNRNGCTWRNLPGDFPPYGIVSHYYHACQDRDGAKLVLARGRRHLTCLVRIWADGAYGGQFVQWVSLMGHWTLEIVQRSDRRAGFEVVPHRWVVGADLWLA